MSTVPVDRLARPLRDLRVSVTDRCNFRCSYCMPREVFGPDYHFLPRAEILTYEEIARLVRICSGLGVRKVRLTGGEPLLRTDLPKLVEMVAAIGDLDIAITTNGVLLPQMAEQLAAAGLDRINVSLDSIDDGVFRRMNDAEVGVEEVLEGIDAAVRSGLRPIKINAVVVRGVNDGGLVDLVRHFKGSGHVVRLIEYMDVGTSNGWRLDRVVPAAEMLAALQSEFSLEPVAAAYPGEVAKRWRHTDGGGEIGLITSITQSFCGACTRARLSAEGRLYTCLFARDGVDLRGVLRGSASDGEIRDLLASLWRERADRYSEIRSENTLGLPRVEMSYIGG